MSNDFGFLTLFLLGFFGGMHCMGMCGGLSSAFALHLPPHIGRVKMMLMLNLGRISSYVLIGTLMGALSQLGILLDTTHTLQTVLFTLANVLLLFMGLHLAGIWSVAAHIEHIGKPIWRKLNPLLNTLLPIRSLWGAYGVGALWGWLPCGLVYNASLYALGSGSAQQGGLYLLAFGLGTLPNLLMVGVFASQLVQYLRHRVLRFTTGLLMSAWSLWQLILFYQ